MMDNTERTVAAKLVLPDKGGIDLSQKPGLDVMEAANQKLKKPTDAGEEIQFYPDLPAGILQAIKYQFDAHHWDGKHLSVLIDRKHGCLKACNRSTQDSKAIQRLRKIAQRFGCADYSFMSEVSRWTGVLVS